MFYLSVIKDMQKCNMYTHVYSITYTNISALILPFVYIHILEASMSNSNIYLHTANLNKDPTISTLLSPKNSARQPQCLMEPHFAAPVPPDMPLMVKWSALPFTTPGNVEVETFRFALELKRKGKKCPHEDSPVQI